MQRESSSLDGYRILAELDRRDRAYYYWSILAFVFSFLTIVIVYPPWLGHGQYLPSDYGTNPVHIQALQVFNGYDEYVEMMYAIIVRVLLGLLAKGYFAIVRFRDNLLSVTTHQE